MERKLTDGQLQALAEYYRNKGGFVLLGMNDSQGVNVTPTFFKKGMLQIIADELRAYQVDTKVIDACSLTVNKTENIDHILTSNLTVEEIKHSQVYGASSAIKHVLGDQGPLASLGDIAGKVYGLVYPVKQGDDKCRITSVLSETAEPSLIYTSGINNLMREVGNNPWSIEKDYKAQNTAFNWTLEKVKDPRSLSRTIAGVESNFEHILTINNTTDIYTLGSYIPKSLESGEGKKVFRELVNLYNEMLQQLCDSYGISFIDMSKIGSNHTTKKQWHVDSAGHMEMSDYILATMYERKIASGEISTGPKTDVWVEEQIGGGAARMIDFAKDDIERAEAEKEALIREIDELASWVNNYPDQETADREISFINHSIYRSDEVLQERHREEDVFSKVLERTTKK